MILTASLAAAGTVFVGARLARALFVSPPPSPPVVSPPGDPAAFDGPIVAGRPLEDWRIDGALLLSTGGLAGLGVGAVTTLPAAVVVAPVLGVVVAGFVVRAAADYRRDDQIGVAVVDVVSSAGSLAAGHLTALSTFMISVHLTRRIARGNEDRTRRVLGRLLAELSPTAWRVVDGVPVEVPIEALGAGDVIEVSAGLPVPVDGRVIGGMGRIDRRALTGESALHAAGVDDEVHAAELLVEGRLRVRVEQAGAATRAAQIEALLDEATGYRRRYRADADDVVDNGARVTLAAAAAGLVALGPHAALAISFAPIAYAMRYTAPISVLGHMQLAASSGLLVKDGRALELISSVDVVVFDKTGTLTETTPTVELMTPMGGADVDRVLALAAAAEGHQRHPIAVAIRAEAGRRGLSVPDAADVEVRLGRGLAARIGEHTVRVGSARLLAGDGIEVDAPAAREAEADGLTVVYVAIDGAPAAWIGLRARPRPEAAALLARLAGRGLDIHLLSGDRPAPTAALADALGIETWQAEILPDQKARHITDLQARGRRVCFVGDGLNDAVALERADVAVGMGSASSLARDLSSVVLLDDHLDRLDTLWALGDSVARDLGRSTLLTSVPNAVVMGGVLFYGLGFNAAWGLFQLGLWSSMAVALRPVIAARLDREGESVETGSSPRERGS